MALLRVGGRQAAGLRDAQRQLPARLSRGDVHVGDALLPPARLHHHHHVHAGHTTRPRGRRPPGTVLDLDVTLTRLHHHHHVHARPTTRPRGRRPPGTVLDLDVTPRTETSGLEQLWLRCSRKLADFLTESNPPRKSRCSMDRIIKQKPNSDSPRQS